MDETRPSPPSGPERDNTKESEPPCPIQVNPAAILSNWRDVWTWYLTGIHHDVNNTLACIMAIGDNMIDSIKEGPPPDGDALSDMEYIVKSAGEAGKWFQTLSRYHHAIPEEPSYQDIATLNDEIIGFASKSLPDYIELHIEGQDTSIPILMDPFDYRLMLLNVIRNAAEALPESGGGAIHISTALIPTETTGDPLPHWDAHERLVRIRVQDRGLGISPWRIPHLFSNIGTSKLRHRGLGLGLPVTRTLAHRYGGDVRIDSSKASGTEVEILLPPLADLDSPELPECVTQKSILLLGRLSETKAVAHSLKPHYEDIQSCHDLNRVQQQLTEEGSTFDLLLIVDPEFLCLDSLQAIKQGYPQLKTAMLLSQQAAKYLPPKQIEFLDLILHHEGSDLELTRQIASAL